MRRSIEKSADIRLEQPTSCLQSIAEFKKEQDSNLSKAYTVVRCQIDSKGYALGSVEGRVSIDYVEEKDRK